MPQFLSRRMRVSGSVTKVNKSENVVSVIDGMSECALRVYKVQEAEKSGQTLKTCQEKRASNIDVQVRSTTEVQSYQSSYKSFYGCRYIEVEEC
jgi:hypothetical protein